MDQIETLVWIQNKLKLKTPPNLQLTNFLTNCLKVLCILSSLPYPNTKQISEPEMIQKILNLSKKLKVREEYLFSIGEYKLIEDEKEKLALLVKIMNYFQKNEIQKQKEQKNKKENKKGYEEEKEKEIEKQQDKQELKKEIQLKKEIKKQNEKENENTQKQFNKPNYTWNRIIVKLFIEGSAKFSFTLVPTSSLKNKQKITVDSNKEKKELNQVFLILKPDYFIFKMLLGFKLQLRYTNCKQAKIFFNKESETKFLFYITKEQQFKLESQTSQQRFILKKTFKMFQHYYGEYVEMHGISGKILGLETEIEALSLRCFNNGKTTFDIHLIDFEQNVEMNKKTLLNNNKNNNKNNNNNRAESNKHMDLINNETTEQTNLKNFNQKTNFFSSSITLEKENLKLISEKKNNDQFLKRFFWKKYFIKELMIKNASNDQKNKNLMIKLELKKRNTNEITIFQFKCSNYKKKNYFNNAYQSLPIK